MVVEIISISLVIIITYVYLVFLLLKREPFKKMIIISMSIFLFFIIIFKSLTNIMGYPVMYQLPSKFNLLYVKVIDEKIFILVDENTHQHCLPIFIDKIETNVAIEIIEIESGEENKNIDTCVGVWNAITELGGDRKSLLITLGGGVITDLGGFVAGCFKRGIDFINVPTTLLSQVDAAFGGKLVVDLEKGKNWVGLFQNQKFP